MPKDMIGELFAFIIGLYLIIVVVNALDFDYGSLILGGVIVAFFWAFIKGRF